MSAAAEQRDAALRTEQAFLDRAYGRLDELRAHYEAEQRRVEATGAWGSPQARTERDAFAAHFANEVARLSQVEDRLVFGRLDLDDGAKRYVGRIGLRDANDDQFLIDWRAPASRPFYQATARNPEGVVRRRHLATSQRQVTGIEDELLDAAAAAAQGTVFQGEGALFAAMSRGREGRMTDIVATIQAEQDAVVRAPANGLLVVQGGPGTGKTAVALHRAAYLLYTDRQRLERSGVLVVGPSRTFLRYIQDVLPALGESGVVNMTIGELLPGLHATQYDSAELTALKGRLEWRDICARAVRSLQRPLRQEISVPVGGTVLRILPEDVRQAMTRARRTGAPHNVARETYALAMVETLTSQYAGGRAPQEEWAWMREEVRTTREIKRHVNLSWMPTSARTLLERLYSQPQFLADCAPGLSRQERQLLVRPRGSDWTIADIPILDELAELLGPHQQADSARTRLEDERHEVALAQQAIDQMNLGGGMVTAEVLAQRARGTAARTTLAERAASDRTWTYGHIVVDEAQELSPLAWHCLLRRCPARSFTVVGDLDQRSGTQRAQNWRTLLGPAARAWQDEAVLTISYRTPATILDRAVATLTAAGAPPVFPVRAARDLPGCLAYTAAIPETTESGAASASLLTQLPQIVSQEKQMLDKQLGAGGGLIAIIAPAAACPEIQAKLAPTEDPERVLVATPTQTKGLEFDTVILWEPSEILAGGAGDLYVALTRPTRRLHVAHSQPLPAGLATD